MTGARKGWRAKGIRRLPEFATSPDEGVLLQDKFCDHLRIEIREVCHILHDMLKVSEMVRHGVKENGGEDVVVFNFAHGGDAVVIASHFSECVAERCFIGETNLKDFLKKADLGVSAVVFVERAETDENIVRGTTAIDAENRHVCSRDPQEHERTDGVIVLHPGVVGVR
jgi:hypothetical protein